MKESRAPVRQGADRGVPCGAVRAVRRGACGRAVDGITICVLPIMLDPNHRGSGLRGPFPNLIARVTGSAP